MTVRKCSSALYSRTQMLRCIKFCKLPEACFPRIFLTRTSAKKQETFQIFATNFLFAQLYLSGGKRA